MTNNNTTTRLQDLRRLLGKARTANHTNLIPILEAKIEAEEARGAITCDAPEAYHPGFPCNHPPFDPEA